MGEESLTEPCRNLKWAGFTNDGGSNRTDGDLVVLDEIIILDVLDLWNSLNLRKRA